MAVDSYSCYVQASVCSVAHLATRQISSSIGHSDYTEHKYKLTLVAILLSGERLLVLPVIIDVLNKMKMALRW